MELSKFDPKEADNVAEIIKISEEMVQSKRINNQQRIALRDQHPKSHGCVEAEFIVGDVPEDLRIGIFKEPRTYRAWIRFSNGNGDIQPDTKPDVRGMAIKVMDVDGEKFLEAEKHEKTQDFILINSETFFLKDIQDALELARAIFAASKIPSIPLITAPLKLLTLILMYAKSHKEQVRILKTASNKAVSNPLLIQYWSGTPYKLGKHAIKFSVKHHDNDVTANKNNSSKSENFLREAMVEYLNKQDAFFDFLVQVQTNSEKMPLEDATIKWDSPYYKVATIKIQKQTFDTKERQHFDENLSYSPWHSLPEHEPLGKINQMRQLVYEATSKLRHELNAQPRKEPSE